MTVCEAALFAVLGLLLLITSITDCRYSLIRNRHIVIFSVIAVIIDAVYYSIWGTGFLPSFLMNLGLLSLVSIILYGYHLWAAGDCKLMIAVALCIPGRFLTFWEIGPFASFVIVVFTFSFAFIYLILETIVLDIKNKSFFKARSVSLNWKQFLSSYFSMTAATTLISLVLSFLFPAVYAGNTSLLMAINFLIVLTLIQIRHHFSMKTQAVFAAAAWAYILGVSLLVNGSIPFSFNLRSLVSVLAIMLVWSFAERYNYQAIPTSKVKAGQIMSLSTIMDFSLSKVRGLPTGQTEDLRSRISEEEAESIRRWENSSTGKPFVIIVRKIPFAVFISLGTLLFLFVEVLMQWQD